MGSTTSRSSRLGLEPIFDDFMEQCIHNTNETDWVSFDAVMNAFAYFFWTGLSRQDQASYVMYDLGQGYREQLRAWLNKKYFTYGSQKYSVVVGVKLLWPRADHAMTRPVINT